MHRGSSQRAPPPIQSQVSHCSPLHPGPQIHRCSSPATFTHLPFSLQSWSHLANDATKTHFVILPLLVKHKRKIYNLRILQRAPFHGPWQLQVYGTSLPSEVVQFPWTHPGNSIQVPQSMPSLNNDNKLGYYYLSYIYHSLHLDPPNIMCDPEFYAFDIYHPISQPHLFGLLHTPLTHSGLSQMGWAHGKSSSW